MEHVLVGRLTARVSPAFTDVLSGATVKLYRIEDTGPAVEAGRILNDEEVRAEERRLLAQGDSDDQGAYSVGLQRDRPRGYRGSPHPYAGEPLEMHLLFLRVGSDRDWAPGVPVQVSVGPVAPEWREVDGTLRAEHPVELPEAVWGSVRAALDEWVVTGRVTDAGGAPLPGVTVEAFDADLVQHDFLGTAVTGPEGRFRIDFQGEAFRRTPGGVGSFESGGPDLFFKVRGTDGSILLEEGRGEAGREGRKNAAGCMHADLVVG
jgi:hypothetical protein